MTTALLPLEEAQRRLLALASPLTIEDLAIEETLGRYLIEPLRALRTQPAADMSAMDGYAVADPDGPWRVNGESAAGHPFTGAVRPGEAVRISTGALLPAGAGMVLLQENCIVDADRLMLSGDPGSDRHIRRRGLDFLQGQELLPVGTRIGPAQMALAITAGHARLPVCRVPHIAIIESGDELSKPGEPCPAHRIPASNGAMLAALASDLPCRITRVGPIGDDLNALREALESVVHVDVIVTSGGASVGAHDLIGPALREWGADIHFWKVAIKPGKPLLVARRDATIVLGLPGNPASSLVTAFLFLLPLLRALLGASQCLPRAITTRLSTPLAATGRRREFVRAHWDGDCARAGQRHDSGALASMALCNLLIDRPPDSAALAAGDIVSAYMLIIGGIA